MLRLLRCRRLCVVVVVVEATALAPPLGGAASTYTLSMGHRIQVLSYNGFEKRVDVRSYRSRHGNNADESNRFDYEYALWCGAVWKPNLQPDFDVRVCDRFDAKFSAGLRELDKGNRFVQKSAESTSM